MRFVQIKHPADQSSTLIEATPEKLLAYAQQCLDRAEMCNDIGETGYVPIWLDMAKQALDHLQIQN